MSDKEFKQKRNQLLEDLKNAKVVEEKARKKYMECMESMDSSAQNLLYWERKLLKVEDQLKNLEWKHGKDSPECTGTEY